MHFGVKYPYRQGQTLSLEDAFEFISDIRFDHVDLSGLFINDQKFSIEFVNRFLEISGSYNISHSFHLAYRECVTCPPNQCIREEALKRYLIALDIAGRVGSKFISMHPIYTYYGKDMRQLTLKVFKDLTDYAEEVGIPLAVENQIYPGFHTNLYPNSLDEFSYLFDNVKDVYFLLDIGHAFIEGGDDCIQAYIKQFSDRLIGIHISDNFGLKDEHLPVGEGKIDFQRLMTNLTHHDFKGPLIIEIYKVEGFQKSKEKLLTYTWNKFKQ